jgi:hypothetical protein
MEHIGGDEGDDEASITCSNGNRKASLEFIYCSTVHSFDSLPCESHLYTVSLFGGSCRSDPPQKVGRHRIAIPNLPGTSEKGNRWETLPAMVNSGWLPLSRRKLKGSTIIKASILFYSILFDLL